MTLYSYHPIANGLGTDHPIPDLPFVDDSHIPDEPAAIEAIGRHEGGETWGREDNLRDAGWSAFTTDPMRHDLAWCVRWHPEHGRSVVLYADSEGASVHSAWSWGSTALLFRSGGYWWDGETWYRVAQLWDDAAERYVRRPVPGAMTVTAADLLDGSGNPDRATLLDISDIADDMPQPKRWLDDLALWAEHRRHNRPLEKCIVKLAAPELTGDQLVGVAAMAQIAEIGASTLRAYLSRGEGEVPLPQAVVGGRPAWSRAVAEEWAQKRNRSYDSVSASVSVERSGASVPVGTAELWNTYTTAFFGRLWENPAMRKRWTLRWRTKEAVRSVAEDLAWTVAAGLDRTIPMDDLAEVVQQAVLHELARGAKLHGDNPNDPVFFGILPHVARMLDWLARHEPNAAKVAISGIIGDAERDLEIPRDVSVQSIKTALALDGKLSNEARKEFLDRVLPTL